MKLRPLIAATMVSGLALVACGSGGSYGAASTSSAPSTTSATSTPMTSATVATRDSSLGNVLVDAKQQTLYGLTKDSAGVPTCDGACATAWPPLTIDGANLPAGLDPTVFSVVTRSDGSHQLKAGKWPLYRYAGDAAPGDTNGQASGGVWYVVSPSGALNKS